ncbi:MAG: uroporphyrinogen-III synthase [Proteobacteria bacterium]|nr:uroporphyrinogen-III synthase [Pseudomonadota bacterium]
MSYVALMRFLHQGFYMLLSLDAKNASRLQKEREYKMGLLSNLCVLITRPAHQAQSLVKAIQSLGGKTVLYPTLEIVPIQDLTLIKSIIAELDQYTWIIFTSANAVWQSVPLIKQEWPTLPATLKIAAIGEVTAHCLFESEFPVHAYPKNEGSSERLLDLPELQNVKDEKILIVAGEGGRELLEITLQNRGAQLKKVAVYRRIRPEPILTYEQLEEAHIDIVISTSEESLVNLCEMIKNKSLFEWPLLIMSERIKFKAQQLGFQNILIAEKTSDQGLIDTLCAWNQIRK